MYLKAGIGGKINLSLFSKIYYKNYNFLKLAFCMVALLQCCIEIAEGFENFVQNRFNCYFETFDAIISILQFLFSCLQFLFIFLRGNVI